MKTKNNQLSGNGLNETNLQLLPLIMNNIPQAVFWKDLDLVYLGCNRAFAADAGLSSPEEIIGKTDFDMPWHEQAELYRADDQAVMESGNSKLNYEEPQTTPDGSTIWLRTSKIPIRENDKVVAVLGMYEDITEYKKVDETIRDERRNFQTILENIRVPMIISRLSDGSVLYANQAIADVSQVDLNKLIGFNTGNFYANPDDRKVVLESLRQHGHIDDLEVQFQRTDGSTYWALLSSHVVRYQNETCVLSSYIDITGLIKSEHTLRDSQQLLQTVMDNIPQSIFWKDSNLTYLGCNKAFARDAGLSSPEEVIGKTDWDMPWKEQAELYRADDSQVMKTGTSKLNYEEPQTTPDGSVIWLRTGKVPMLNSDGKASAVLGMYEDITERKQLETQVQEAFERRGHQVQLSTEVSQEIAAASETNELFDRVVKLTKERFGYYHTQLLRYDPARDSVILINGYGETGQKMLAGGHKMPMGEGLIGTAAATGETVMRPTLADDPDWHPNPLLPDTRGEIAVPIKWQNQVLGVLDVQSDQAGVLAEDDRLLLEGLCGQIAIAMHSTELVKILRQNEARLAEALKIARLGNWEYDFENDQFHFTDEFYAIFRTTAEKVGGYKISSADYAKHFVHPDDAPLVGIEIQRVLDAKDRLFTTHLEHRIIFSDGETGYISVNINVERDENGKITRWYGANQDITERKKAEEALRINEARLAEALTAARLANWEYDVEKDLFTFNDQFYSIFHTTAEKAGGYQLSSARYAELFVYPDDMEVVGLEIGKALSSKDKLYNTTIDHRIIYADGGVGYISVKLTVERDENGKITRYYGANQDITEQRKVQEEMAERLEEINRLYQNMSREGWKTYRETADLPAGFVFDKLTVRPIDESILSGDQFSTDVPVKVPGGELVGTLSIVEDPQHPISEEDRSFLQQVSEQIALALESARLSAQTQSALAQTEMLFQSSRTLTQAADLQELTAATMKLLGIPEMNRAVLTTFNYDVENNIESLDIVANWWNGTGHEVTVIGAHYPISVIRAMSFFVSPTPVFFNDTITDSRVDATTLQLVQRLNLRSVGVLPLYAGTHQIGALVLEGEEPHKFTEEETRLFTALAPQIATMLDNRRQFERAQKQAQREAMLNAIGQKIQSATTVEAVLQIAARELGRALSAPLTVAQLGVSTKTNGHNEN